MGMQPVLLVSGNLKSLRAYFHLACRLLRKWLNRSSQRHLMTQPSFWLSMTCWLPRVHIVFIISIPNLRVGFKLGAGCCNPPRLVLRGAGSNGLIIEIVWHRRETRRKIQKTNINLQYWKKPVYSTQKLYQMLIKRETEMKKLALIVLIMVLGLSRCASSGTSGLIIQDWIEFWN